MNMGPVALVCLYFFQQQLIIKVHAGVQCAYKNGNGVTNSTYCSSDCCSTSAADSADDACCTSLSWSSLAVPFFVVTAICIAGICCISCRPLWKACLCGMKCPCSHRTQVETSNSLTSRNNQAIVVNNDGLPDYDAVLKDQPAKDSTPPPYNFVASHPTAFDVQPRVPSAPPQYHSRRTSIATANTDTPTQS